MTLAAYSRASFIISLVNLGYSFIRFSGDSAAAISSTISLTKILVPLNVGFPWQISVSTTICLLISTLISLIELTKYLKMFLQQNKNRHTKRLVNRMLNTKAMA